MVIAGITANRNYPTHYPIIHIAAHGGGSSMLWRHGPWLIGKLRELNSLNSLSLSQDRLILWEITKQLIQWWRFSFQQDKVTTHSYLNIHLELKCSGLNQSIFICYNGRIKVQITIQLLLGIFFLLKNWVQLGWRTYHMWNVKGTKSKTHSSWREVCLKWFFFCLSCTCLSFIFPGWAKL